MTRRQGKRQWELEAERGETLLADKLPIYTGSDARAEAERCLYCVDAPCIAACPTEIDIPTFIQQIASGNVRGSAKTIFSQNLLGASCARACPVEVLCAGACVVSALGHEPIAIGRLQRFATETALSDLGQGGLRALVGAPRPSEPVAFKKVACIGSGPAALAFAGELALAGHNVTIFEKKALPGGLTTSGIAPYKLHAPDALREVEFLVSLGVQVITCVEVGDADSSHGISCMTLLETYDVVFLGIGLGTDRALGLPGEACRGVFGATAWVERLKVATQSEGYMPSVAGKNVVVIGGGNTAVDVARECAQLGAAEVSIFYRRGERAMSAYAHELRAARVEHVRFFTNMVPVAFVQDERSGELRAVRVARTRIGSSNPEAFSFAEAESEVRCDLALVAIGTMKPSPRVPLLLGVEVDDQGCVVRDPKTGQTANPRVWAGGDCANGGREVVNAVAEGRNAARGLLATWSRVESMREVDRSEGDPPGCCGLRIVGRRRST